MQGGDSLCPSCGGILYDSYQCCPYCGYRRHSLSKTMPVKIVRGIGEDIIRMLSLDTEAKQVVVFPRREEETGRAAGSDTGPDAPTVEEMREGAESDLALIMRKIGVMMTLAEQGDVDAQCSLAMSYYEGLYLKKNLFLSRFWFSQAAAQGDAYATTMLNSLDFAEEDSGQPETTLPEMKNLPAKAADGAAVKEEALPAGLADCTEDEKAGGKEGQETDIAGTGKDILRSSADQGDSTAQYLLAQACLKNPEQKKEAAYWLARSASQGDRDAILELAVCYLEGYGIRQDEELACRMLESLSQKGDPEAQCSLAICLYLGRGTKTDHRMAAYWLRKASAQGEKHARALLADWFDEA